MHYHEKISTTLPTEPGNYLFCGSRNGYIRDAADLHRWRVEFVRVFFDADNRLRYIGSDFFYEPEKAVGTWLSCTEEAAVLKKESAVLLLDHAARTLLPKVFGKHSSLHTTTSALRELAGYNKDVDTQQTAQQVFDRAVALGVIVSAEYPNCWKLAETSPG